jgi:hypothetical protein
MFVEPATRLEQSTPEINPFQVNQRYQGQIAALTVLFLTRNPADMR